MKEKHACVTGCPHGMFANQKLSSKKEPPQAVQQ